MTKYGPPEGPCRWEENGAGKDLEDLHKILNCAATRGCAECVTCSERALERMLNIARGIKTFSFLAIDQMEGVLTKTKK